MDIRMKPAAEASCSGRVEYTKVLTAEVVNTSPAAKKPTIYFCQLGFPLIAKSFLRQPGIFRASSIQLRL